MWCEGNARSFPVCCICTLWKHIWHKGTKQNWMPDMGKKLHINWRICDTLLHLKWAQQCMVFNVEQLVLLFKWTGLLLKQVCINKAFSVITSNISRHVSMWMQVKMRCKGTGFNLDSNFPFFLPPVWTVDLVIKLNTEQMGPMLNPIGIRSWNYQLATTMQNNGH